MAVQPYNDIKGNGVQGVSEHCEDSKERLSHIELDMPCNFNDLSCIGDSYYSVKTPDIVANANGANLMDTPSTNDSKQTKTRKDVFNHFHLSIKPKANNNVVIRGQNTTNKTQCTPALG